MYSAAMCFQCYVTWKFPLMLNESKMYIQTTHSVATFVNSVYYLRLFFYKFKFTFLLLTLHVLNFLYFTWYTIFHLISVLFSCHSIHWGMEKWLVYHDIENGSLGTAICWNLFIQRLDRRWCFFSKVESSIGYFLSLRRSLVFT